MTTLDQTPLVAVHATGQITEITIGRGVKRNALTGQGWSEVTRAIHDLERDGTTRVIVVRGRDAMFCAGSDMSEWVGADLERVEDSFARMETAFRAIEECPVPVVAEIHGVAAGAGCQLALACDLRLIADTARIGMPIARLGIKTSPAFAARMIALAGPGLTRRMLYTGTLLDAPAAVAGGLADQHATGAELPEVTRQVVTRIAEQPPEAMRAAKHAVSTALAPMRQATRDHDDTAVSPTAFRHGIAAFLR